MICPHCGMDIKEVLIFSQNVTRGILVGDTVANYGDEEYVGTIGIECPECTEDISQYIKEP
jgi:uncharacterized protein (UPF0212 family)